MSHKAEKGSKIDRKSHFSTWWLWPMTLPIKFLRDMIKVHPSTKFEVCTSNSSSVRALTNRQTDRTDSINLGRWHGRWWPVPNHDVRALTSDSDPTTLTRTTGEGQGPSLVYLCTVFYICRTRIVEFLEYNCNKYHACWLITLAMFQGKSF